MKLVFSISVCILLAGCGLFQRRKTIDRQMAEVARSSQLEVNKSTAVQRAAQTAQRLDLTTRDQEQLLFFPPAGSTVLVKPDGSLALQADSLRVQRSSTKQLIQTREASTTDVQTGRSDSLVTDDSRRMQATAVKSVKEAAGFWRTAALGFGVLIIVFLARWLILNYRNFKWLRF